MYESTKMRRFIAIVINVLLRVRLPISGTPILYLCVILETRLSKRSEENLLAISYEAADGESIYSHDRY